jgi:hypothetical protein
MELHNNIYYSTAFAPKAAVTNDTAQVSAIADRANGEDIELVCTLGTNADTDMTYTVLIEDGDNAALSDNAAVADAYLLGVEAMGLNYASDGKTFKIGYIGTKRYVRATITPANNTGNVFLSGVWVQGGARKLPKSTQVV